MAEFDTPQSRVEALLQNALGGTNAVDPQSRVEELLERLDQTLEDMGVGTRTNVDTVIENGKIQFFTKGGD